MAFPFAQWGQKPQFFGPYRILLFPGEPGCNFGRFPFLNLFATKPSLSSMAQKVSPPSIPTNFRAITLCLRASRIYGFTPIPPLHPYASYVALVTGKNGEPPSPDEVGKVH